MLKDCPNCWHEVLVPSDACESCGTLLVEIPEVINDDEWEEFERPVV